MNPYEVLEIAPNASPEEIKEAYHSLAKKWHPDRFMGPEHEVAEKRFRELAEAFGMLKNVAPKIDLAPHADGATASTAAGSPSFYSIPPAARTTEDWFAEAKAAFEAKDMARALGLIQYAIKMDAEKADFHILHAKILDRPGGDVRKLVQTLETVIKLNPREVNTAIRLAELYQSVGLNTKATRMWETAMRIDPSHPVFHQDAPKSSGLGQLKNLGEQFNSLLEDAKGLFRRFKK